jgi:hypothetical protein
MKNNKRDIVVSLLTLAVIICYFFIMLSCKSTKNDCDAYGYAVEKDTITIVTEHINYNNVCSESAIIKTVITDTIYFKKHDVQFN